MTLDDLLIRKLELRAEHAEADRDATHTELDTVRELLSVALVALHEKTEAYDLLAKSYDRLWARLRALEAARTATAA